jgi:hypothetical protein
MDNRFLLAALLLCALPAQSQSAASAFLDMVPKFPSSCDDDQESFHKEVAEALKQMDRVMKPLDEQTSKAMEQVARKKAEAMGLPPGSKGGKTLSPEQKRQITDKMLQAQFGANAPTAEEVEKLKTMSPEARKAWAQGFSAQVTADAQADPQKYRDASKTSQTAYKDQQRLQDLLRQIQGPAQKINDRMNDLAQEYDQLRMPRGLPDPEQRTKRACMKILPEVASVQQDYLTLIKKNFATLDEVDALQAKQAGLDKCPVPGLSAMHQVRAYVAGLIGAFQMFL